MSSGGNGTGGSQFTVMQRVLITGAKGMLGLDLTEALGRRYEVYGRDIDDFDITRDKETMDAITGIRPDIVEGERRMSPRHAGSSGRKWSISARTMSSMERSRELIPRRIQRARSIPTADRSWRGSDGFVPWWANSSSSERLGYSGGGETIS